jgi:RNA polymerase sigma-70 factor (ECF subfamily)
MIATQAGDNEAYLSLLSNMYGFLRNYIRRRIFNADEGEEVIQEILMAVHKSRHTYDSSRSLMSWFLSIAEFKIIDSIRKASKASAELSLDQMQENLSYTFFEEQTFDFDKAFQKLNEKEQQIIKLLKIDGFKISEAAMKMNLTEANIKVIAHRAYKNLQMYLGDEFENK